MASHMTNISGLAECGRTEELRQYIKTLDDSIKSIEMKFSTGNPVTDVVINDRCRKAEEQDIAFSTMFIYDEKWNISVYDICVIIGNLLDNAVRAASGVKYDTRYVTLQLKERENFIVIICENSYDADETTVRGGDKDDNARHGLGLKNIRDITERYDGWMNIEKNECVFVVKILLKKQQ